MQLWGFQLWGCRLKRLAKNSFRGRSHAELDFWRMYKKWTLPPKNMLPLMVVNDESNGMESVNNTMRSRFKSVGDQTPALQISFVDAGLWTCWEQSVHEPSPHATIRTLQTNCKHKAVAHLLWHPSIDMWVGYHTRLEITSRTDWYSVSFTLSSKLRPLPAEIAWL